MARSIWSALFGGSTGKRDMSVDDYMAQYMEYQGKGYPLSGSIGQYDTKEQIGNDFEGYVQGAYKSDGVVFACMVARQFLFSEARFQFQQMRSGRPGDLFGTPELAVLEKPWPSGSTDALLSRAIQHADLGGNHYAARDGKRIRWMRPDWVDIILTAPPAEASDVDIAGWIYKPGGTEDRKLWKMYTAGDSRFAHWAPIPDPEANFRGMSWLTPVIREVMADKAATKHKGKFFDNAATPNLAVSFKETVSAQQFKDFMSTMNEEHGGADNAYKTLYLGGGADVQVIGANMRELDFKVTQGAGETRIAAAARVHPVVVGLSEGMQGSSLNAGNFKAAKDSFGDGTMRPLWHSLCSAYEQLVEVPDGSRLWYDDRDIAFLRDDIVQQAEVQMQEASIISRLVMEGYTPESVVTAVIKRDWRLLEHTGLYSVQLQPPLPDGGEPAPDANGDDPKGVKADPKTGKPVATKPDANTPKPAASKPAAATPKPAAPVAVKPKPKA